MNAKLIACLTLGLLTACNPDEQSPTPAGKNITLKLTGSDSGMQYCDATGTCQTLPYDGDCATLEIEINTSTAQSCQRCIMADGTTVDQGCSNSAVACVLVTLPEPDCVVCAYVNGAVLYSSCVTGDTHDCQDYTRPDGTLCQSCYDATGRSVYDSCGADCRDVVCPAVACAEGFVPQRRTGECCDQCLPIDNCEGVICSADSPVPNCPEGSVLSRDAWDCCGFICQPTECPQISTGTNGSDDAAMPRESCAYDSDCSADSYCMGGYCLSVCVTTSDCPTPYVCMNGQCTADTTSRCPSGYMWREDFPYCGQCIWVDDVTYCTADSECAPESYCAFDQGMCVGNSGSGSAGVPAYACAYDGDCPENSACMNGYCSGNNTDVVTPCYGICRPIDPVCTSTDGTNSGAVLADCEGEWYVQPDVNGCPQPVCICPDGSATLDGICRDLCADVACTTVPPSCGVGFHLDWSYPYCCGVCVPDDICAYITDPANNGGTTYYCPETSCAAGYHAEAGADCCPVCVRDLCNSNDQCQSGEHCSTAEGDCLQPDPTISSCYGQCVADQLPCLDSDAGIDIFTPGYVEVAASTGDVTLLGDTCSEDGLSVVELYCYPTANGATVQRVSIRCPAIGCVLMGDYGACYLE